jgi:type I restriction enzyme R subunit
VDLSTMDFAALRRRFRESRHKNSELEQLEAAIRAQLDRPIQLNETRTDYFEHSTYQATNFRSTACWAKEPA